MEAIAKSTMLRADEQQRRLYDWNNTRTEYPRNLCIHQLFEQQVELRPHAIALRFRDQQMSYEELNSRANRVAYRLRQLGAGPEVMVGVLVERSLDMVVGLLAILKAGGAFVSFDINYPAERLAFMASDTASPVMLVQSSVLTKMGTHNWSCAKVVCLDGDRSDVEAERADNLPNLNSAEDLAYVMYTSGSTGSPKGVMVNHRAVVRLVKNTNYVDLSDRETFLQFSPISFDASTLEIWAPLLNGGCLAIMPPEAQSLDQLGAAIRKYGVTSMWLTAGLFNVMVEQRLEDLRPLRQLLVGGDALSPTHVRKAVNGLPECRLINGYGPTEGTTFTCCHTITGADLEGASIPIGKPISNTQVFLLDTHGQPVAIGESGELCVGGDGVARGYLNQPELTQEKFVANSFSHDPNAKLYKTGDLARYRDDGIIEFLGRRDNQVKVNGFRIELGEIETVLMEHPGVQSVVVTARQDGPGEKNLIAYLVLRHPLEEPAFRTFLQQRLPAYMVPSAFVFLKELPLSPNGKVDRQMLPAPNVIAKDVADAPQTDLEMTIAKTWRRLLGLKHVGLDDNFFDLGGDSLQLLEAHAELQKVAKSDLTIADLFEYSTIRSLTRYLSGNSANSYLSEAQERARKQQMIWEQHRQSHIQTL